MFAKITRLRSALISLAFLLAIAAVLNQTITAPVSADGGATSVIVQLRDDPAAVYKAKTVNAGGQVSATQLQAYRDGLRAKQDQFLTDLRNKGVSFSVDGVDVPDFTGALAGHVDYRYTMVLNGIALNVQPAAVSIITGMPQVKSVEATRALKIDLEKSVDYINRNFTRHPG